MNEKYLITADRDEKIRVNNYPQTFDIHNFCLGHTEFVSKIHVLSDDVLISGGGNDYLLTWDYLTGTIIQKIDILSLGLKFEDKPTVVEIISCKSSLVVMLQR